jgi:DNA-binding response OmpR family regulator
MARRILVIEDEPGIVDFLERGLRTHGYDVLTANDGEDGIQRAIEEPIDLVVLDMMLPRRSGL